MYLSLNWLKDFVAIPKKMTPEELALRLTMHTVEVDSVAKQSERFRGVVVGKILKITKHPNADKLQLASVDVKTQKLTIVCGASNIAAGQFVPVALPGAVLPNGVKIEEAVVRGEKSQGMLCAEDELGLGEDHSGIMILDKKAKKGEKFSVYLNLNDVVFEIDNKSITHRPDLWSHYGIAREIAAWLGQPLKEYKPKIDLNRPETEPSEEIVVKVADFNLCPRYMALALSSLKIAPSPKWLSDRLLAAGMRPINNIVDATNYVMLELGQPLHAFDRKYIDRIEVRLARPGEILSTLDGEERKLEENMLVIANGSKAMAVAGVMGGAESEISPDTEAIVIESANFNFLAVRRTAAHLGLRTEASMRYEKSLDPNLCEQGLGRAVELIKSICPTALISSRLADQKNFSVAAAPIKLTNKWLNERWGKKISHARAKDLLIRLGFSVSEEEGAFLVTPPSFRATRDISLKEDILEEIARIDGYEKLPPDMPKMEIKAPAVNRRRQIERRIKTILSGAPALAEVLNYSFVGDDQLTKTGLTGATCLKLANPIASHLNCLRPSLVPNLIGNIKHNQGRHEEFGIYEIGSVFLSIAGSLAKDKSSGETLPHQEKHLGIVITGQSETDLLGRLKGVGEYLFASFFLPVKFEPAEIIPTWLEPKAAGAVIVTGKNAGYLGVLSISAARGSGIKKAAVIMEINLEEIYDLAWAAENIKYREAAKFPPVVRDLAFVLDEKILYNDIREEMFKFHDYIKSVEIFDAFTDPKLGTGKKNLAFHVVYQADRTLTATEADEIQSGLVKRLEERFGAVIRDF